MNINLDGLLPLPALLTTQEAKILSLIDKGMSNKEIGEQCAVTVATVQSHIKNIYRKLEVNSRLQALHRGRELNLL